MPLRASFRRLRLHGFIGELVSPSPDHALEPLTPSIRRDFWLHAQLSRF
jgi:hypothetical protein